MAIISGSGQVMGITPGTAWVTASSGGVTSNAATLTVVQGAPVNITIGSSNDLVGITFPSVAVGISFPSVALSIQIPSQITGSIFGKVIDIATGAGVPGATVRAFLMNVLIANAVTDYSGSFRLNNLAPDSFTLKASAAGYTESATAPVAVAVGATTQGVNIFLGRQ